MSLNPWDVASEMALRGCVASGYSCREAADVLSRGETPIRRKVAELGIEFKPTGVHPHQTMSGGRNVSEAQQQAYFVAGDEKHVSAVLRANVYGFSPNTRILVQVRS